MNDKQITEPTVEEMKVEVPSTEVSEDLVVQESAPAVSTETPLPDYLNQDLFNEVKVVKPEELIEEKEEDVPEDIQKQYLSTFSDISEHQVITGRVIGMTEKEVLIDIGFKSEGIIDRSEFPNEELPSIGSQIDIYVEKLEDRRGNTLLSKSKADFMSQWKNLREIYDRGEIITGKPVRRIKGGMIVELGNVPAFLPGSQIDVRPVKDFDQYLDQDIELKIVKLNEARKNIVVSHKAIKEEEMKEQRDALFEKIKIGEVLEGRVKNITDFGAFIDLGGLDGLLHITDLSWGRVNHPSEVVKMDEEITIKVIDYDEENRRVSLGLKQLTPHPWERVEDNYPIGSVIKGRIVSMTNYGAFMELEPGVEGLIHVSEMSWTRQVKNPSELYSMNDEVEAQVLSIDTEERKISLGAKQLHPDPWDEIEERYMVGTVHNGKVINLTQFGAFVELEEGIDGLIHVSDLSWTKVVRHPKEALEKGQEVEVRVLEVSRESRRISLGYKQVQDDPWPEIVKTYETGKDVTGEIIRTLEKGIILKLDMDVEGLVPFGKRSKKERKRLMTLYKPGEEMTGNVMEVRPDDKKIIVFVDSLPEPEKKASKKDEVQEYLENQDDVIGEKIEIPGLTSEEAEIIDVKEDEK